MANSHLCYCGGQLFASFWVPDRQVVCINVYDIQKDNRNTVLQRKTPHFLFLPLDKSELMISCAIKQSFDFFQGSRDPYLLIGINEDTKFMLIVHKIKPEEGLSQILCETLSVDASPKSPTFSSGCIYLADGPLVVIVKEMSLLVASEGSDFKMQTVATPHNIPVEKVLHIHAFYPFVFRAQSFHVWLIVLKQKDAGHISTGFLVIDFTNKRYWKQIYSIPGDLFLYPAYFSIITSIKINFLSAPSWITSSCEVSTRLGDHLGDRTWLSRNITLVSTCRKQFLVFVEGSLNHCCPIMFPDIVSIHTFHSTKGMVIGLESSTKGVTILMKTHDSLDVFQESEDTLCLFVVHDGENSPQLLLLSCLPGEEDIIVTSCTLVKFDISDSLLKGAPSSQTHVQKSKALQATEQGLYQRLSAGEAALLEIEKNVKEKNTLIEHTVRNLLAACSGHETSISKKANLVNLIPGSHSLSSETVARSTETRIESFVEVCDQWLARWDQFLIFGKTIKNKGTLSMSDLREIFFLDNVELFQSCKVFFSLKSELSEESGPSRLEPSSTCTIIVSMKLPLCTQSNLNFTSILLWHIVKPEENESLEDINMQDSKNKILRHTPSRVSIPINKILNSEIRTVFDLPFYQLIVSLRSKQISEFLSVRSPTLDLSNFEVIVTKDKHDPQLKTMSNTQKFFLFSDQKSPLCGLNISILNCQRNQVDLMTYFRNDQEFNLLLHWLYSVLPDEVVILPDMGSAISQELAKSLNDEIGFIHHTLSSSSGVQLEDRTGKQETAQGNSEQQKEVCYSFLEYKKMRHELTAKETRTDNLVQKLCSMHQSS